METHDIIIIVLIAVILFFQLRVFSQAKSKISLFNNVMPQQPSYKTIKIYIREDEIEKISLNDIFDEIDHYKSDDFEERERKKLEKKYDPFKKNKKNKSKTEVKVGDENSDIEENVALNESDEKFESYEEDNETVDQTIEEIIQSIKKNNKRNLFDD